MCRNCNPPSSCRSLLRNHSTVPRLILRPITAITASQPPRRFRSLRQCSPLPCRPKCNGRCGRCGSKSRDQWACPVGIYTIPIGVMLLPVFSRGSGIRCQAHSASCGCSHIVKRSRGSGERLLTQAKQVLFFRLCRPQGGTKEPRRSFGCLLFNPTSPFAAAAASNLSRPITHSSRSGLSISRRCRG